MYLVVYVYRTSMVQLRLKSKGNTIDKANLTLGRDLDILLIRTLDKIIKKNKIDRLSLKSVKIAGKIRSEMVSGMIFHAIAKAIEI